MRRLAALLAAGWLLVAYSAAAVAQPGADSVTVTDASPPAHTLAAAANGSSTVFRAEIRRWETILSRLKAKRPQESERSIAGHLVAASAVLREKHRGAPLVDIARSVDRRMAAPKPGREGYIPSFTHVIAATVMQRIDGSPEVVNDPGVPY